MPMDTAPLTPLGLLSYHKREDPLSPYLYTSKSGVLISFDYQVIGFYIYYPQDHVLPPSPFQNCQQVFFSCGNKQEELCNRVRFTCTKYLPVKRNYLEDPSHLQYAVEKHHI